MQDEAKKEQLATLIVTLLDAGATIEHQPEFWACREVYDVTLSDGGKLTFLFDGYRKEGKLTVIPKYPEYLDFDLKNVRDDNPKGLAKRAACATNGPDPVSVSYSRSAVAIANDLRRRMLTPYLEALAKVRAEIEKKNTHAEAESKRVIDFDNRVRSFNFTRDGFLVGAQSTSDGFSLDLRWLTNEQASQVLDLLETMKKVEPTA